MKILVINAGSSSLKYQLIDVDNKEKLLRVIRENGELYGGLLPEPGADGADAAGRSDAAEGFRRLAAAKLDAAGREDTAP